MNSLIPHWLLVAVWLVMLQSTALAQTPQSDLEDQFTAQLSSGNEEARLGALVELAGLFKQGRRTARPATIAAVIQVLQNDTLPVLRTHAARVLEYAAPPSATDALLTALQNEREMATRKAVIYALARYPAPPVVAALLPLLRHKEISLRATAAYALAELADTAAASTLHETLTKRRSDQDAFMRAQATRGLGRIGYRMALPDLLKALRKDSAIVRRAAAEAIGWLAQPNEQELIQALQEATRESDPYLRESAQQALQRISQRAAARNFSENLDFARHR
jgi:HEAT repeat protein